MGDKLPWISPSSSSSSSGEISSKKFPLGSSTDIWRDDDFVLCDVGWIIWNADDDEDSISTRRSAAINDGIMMKILRYDKSSICLGILNTSITCTLYQVLVGELIQCQSLGSSIRLVGGTYDILICDGRERNRVFHSLTGIKE